MDFLRNLFSSIAGAKNCGFFIVRLVIGIAFIWHGLPKLAGGVEGWTQLGSMLGALGITIFPAFFGLMSGLVEFFGGILILLGLFYRPAAFLLFVNLLIGTAIVYAMGVPTLEVTRPLEEAFFLLALFFAGPGRHSIDAKLGLEKTADLVEN